MVYTFLFSEVPACICLCRVGVRDCIQHVGSLAFQTTEVTDLQVVTNLHQHHVRVLSFCHWGAVCDDSFSELIEGPPKEAYSNSIWSWGLVGYIAMTYRMNIQGCWILTSCRSLSVLPGIPRNFIQVLSFIPSF